MMVEGIGDSFQKETKYARGRTPAGGVNWAGRADLYKEYPSAEKTRLPSYDAAGLTTLNDCLLSRKSVRDFSPEPLSLRQISYLLWASTGIQRREDGYAFRTSPSAGALYPVETYLVANNIEQLAKGVYHYSVKDHSLEGLKAGEFGDIAASSALDQKMCARAQVVFIWTAIFQRSKWKYGQRAYRYVYLDAGHIAAHLSLAAVSLGLGSCQIAALYDDEVNSLLGVDGSDESVLYMTALGNR